MISGVNAFESDVEKLKVMLSGFLKTGFADVGDLVILLMEPGILNYGVVLNVEHHEKKMGTDWWKVTISMLTLPPPPNDIIWIVREQQMVGEIFTMGGRKMFMQPLTLKTAVVEEKPTQDIQDKKENSEETEQCKILDFVEYRKRRAKK